MTPWTAACQASLSITNSRSLLRFMSIESVMPSSHLILCHPLLLPPSIFPSIRVFSNESVLRIRWPKYWSFSFSISPSSEYSALISFRMDWLDLLAVRGTLKSLLQHHSSKASTLRCPALFIVQLSHPHTTTGKTTALTRRTSVGKCCPCFVMRRPALSQLVTVAPCRHEHGDLGLAAVAAGWMLVLCSPNRPAFQRAQTKLKPAQQTFFHSILRKKC